jgi:hypothetical protein
MNLIVDYISDNNIIIVDNNNDNDDEPNITVSKFNKNIDEIENNLTETNKDDNLEEELEEEELEDDFESNFGQDNFKNYINKDSISSFTKNAEFCTFNWNGIDLLDKWELQRKVDKNHATELVKAMLNDLKKYKEFVFYDPIHIGKKKVDLKYYVLDGQHRLEAYLWLYERNKYPIQQIPIIIWYVDDDEDFIELFQKINNRLSLDKLKLIQIKLLEIFEELEKKYGKNIYGQNRPKINKEIFADKLKNNDNVHKLTTNEILIKLVEINEKIRGKPRTSRVKPNVNSSIHNSAEIMDFFLGLDKTMSWISDI